MKNLPLEARLALEWLKASGERTPQRLQNLIEHFCTTNGVMEPQTRAAIYQAALTQLNRI
jgi:hypothetical protein